MSLIATAVRHLIAAGVQGEALLAAIAELEEQAAVEGPAPLLTARQQRNARYYDRHMRRDASRAFSSDAPPSDSPSETVLIQTLQTVSAKRLNPSESVLNPDGPRAGVEDKSLTKEVSGAAAAASRDWPKTDIVAKLCRRVASPRLDPHKSLGLITSAYRFEAWRRAGAGFKTLVLPVIRDVAHRPGGPIRQWTYFDDAIARALAAALQPLETTEPDLAQPRSRSPRSAHPTESRTDANVAGAALALARRHARQAGAAQGVQSGGPAEPLRLPR